MLVKFAVYSTIVLMVIFAYQWQTESLFSSKDTGNEFDLKNKEQSEELFDSLEKMYQNGNQGREIAGTKDASTFPISNEVMAKIGKGHPQFLYEYLTLIREKKLTPENSNILLKKFYEEAARNPEEMGERLQTVSQMYDLNSEENIEMYSMIAKLGLPNRDSPRIIFQHLEDYPDLDEPYVLDEEANVNKENPLYTSFKRKLDLYLECEVSNEQRVKNIIALYETQTNDSAKTMILDMVNSRYPVLKEEIYGAIFPDNSSR